MLGPTKHGQTAIGQGYVVVAGGKLSRRFGASGEYAQHCIDADEPIIEVELGAEHARVQVDLVWCSWRMSDSAMTRIYLLLRDNNEGSGEWPYVTMNNCIMTAPRVPLDRAAHVARDIVSILAERNTRYHFDHD